MPDDMATQLRDALRGRTDVRVAVLFGSQARGEAREGSDVDLAIDAPGVDLLALAADLGERLGRDVDVIALEDAPIPLLTRIVRDGRVVHEGRPGAGALFRSRTLATLETDLPWYRRMSDAWLARVAAKGIGRG